MKTHVSLLPLVGIVLSLGTSSTVAAAVIPVTGLQVIAGAGGNIAGKATDAQPLTDPVANVALPADAGGESFAINGTGSSRAMAFDFGVNYANVTITHTYLLMASYQGNIPSIDDTYHWSDDLDGAFEPGEGDVVATDFNLLNVTVPQGVPGGGTKKWIQTYENLAGVTPQHRYLILTNNGGNEGNFKYEIAFVHIPEPASLGLMALAGLTMLGRTRRER